MSLRAPISQKGRKAASIGDASDARTARAREIPGSRKVGLTERMRSAAFENGYCSGFQFAAVSEPRTHSINPDMYISSCFSYLVHPLTFISPPFLSAQVRTME